MYKILPKFMAKQEYRIIKDSKEKVSLEDLCYIKALKEYIIGFEHNLPASTTEAWMQQLNRFYGEDIEWVESIINICRFASMLTAWPDKSLRNYFVDPDALGNFGRHNIGSIVFKMGVFRPIKEYVCINGQRRPVYQLFLPQFFGETHYKARVYTKSLGHHYSGSKEQLPIYIQGHALQRLQERIHPINWIELRVALSSFILQDNNIQFVGGKLLLDFTIRTLKIGYLVAEIIDEKVVVKTFILITHASAPEGSMFQELTGFSKYDMSFWNIANIRTFIDNDMPCDNPMYTYFEQSNLLDLFRLNNALAFESSDNKSAFNWNSLSQCLNKYNERDILSEEELANVDYSLMLSS
ncbi:hypothetical protein [Saccharicrinis aurantiacus]|uniref:hypothetical protein n=1 Tax=Saccharicrinis aurantiacus TaxID=1849719 RepID=UPI0024911077|nr:hypothetical protein [Saccharicrinis aurantiacus]